MCNIQVYYKNQGKNLECPKKTGCENWKVCWLIQLISWVFI